jgi:transposase
MARPSKLTRDTEETIVAALRAGMTDDVACGMARVSRRTLQAWLARGAQPGRAHARHRAFRAAVERVRADCEASLVARMTLAAQRGNWHAAAWLLERAYPERWGLR